MGNTTITTPLNFADVDFNDNAAVDAFHQAWIASGREKVMDDMRRLREMGLIDEQGNQIKTIIPADMLDPDADFGG